MNFIILLFAIALCCLTYAGYLMLRHQSFTRSSVEFSIIGVVVLIVCLVGVMFGVVCESLF